MTCFGGNVRVLCADKVTSTVFYKRIKEIYPGEQVVVGAEDGEEGACRAIAKVLWCQPLYNTLDGGNEEENFCIFSTDTGNAQNLRSHEVIPLASTKTLR